MKSGSSIDEGSTLLFYFYSEKIVGNNYTRAALIVDYRKHIMFSSPRKATDSIYGVLPKVYYGYKRVVY